MVNERCERSGFNLVIWQTSFLVVRFKALKKSFMSCSRTLSYDLFPLFLLSTESGVTDDERRLILEEHNYLRQTVATGHVPGQPSAQNMQEMQWDDELAAKAQQWANECTFKHDPSRYLGEFYHQDSSYS